ncbi:cardiolipin synthase [Pseudodesulfovibrio karagichevae]|uniref:Cardiolipin synthase n=1 Tax=Pseudodesulfovibrio karagichevae TaxID=3239305 RepID=A0ABV4K0Q9_9BACT
MESLEMSFLLGLASLLYTAMEITGIITALIAIRETRTPQGAVAWAISLATFPIISLPLYWIFGRSKFHGYVDAMRTGRDEFQRRIGDRHDVPPVTPLSERELPHLPRTVFETLAESPYLGGNKMELLVNGPATFKAIFAAIEKAEKYVLVQFYIVRDDALGKELGELLVRKARQGIHIRFLYDELGSYKTPAAYWDALRAAGVEAHPFHTTRGPGNRFQLNFRNHRKIVVVDGHTAFVGGHNVGTEYLGGKDNGYGGWRDTHARISGPAVLPIQVCFGKDWYWATSEIPDLDLSMPARQGKAEVLALPTGPVDVLENCSLMFIQAIASAKERFWIASPYFVPDTSVMKALQMAAMRGVDVRIMLPKRPDHLMVYQAGFACLKELVQPGIRVFRYDEGFLHQKVFLADNALAGVGTANLDNRSFRLNFEITMLVEDPDFCRDIETMFLNDFGHCVETGTNEFDEKNLFQQTVIRFARLLSPIL